VASSSGSPGPQPEDDFVTVARITRARGNKGEVMAVPLSSRAERFRQLREVFLFREGEFLQERRPFVVERIWEHRDRLIIKFLGVDTISDAERLAGADVRIPGSESPKLPAGEYYQSDLVGCEVVECGSGHVVGRVTGWLDQGGSGLLEVASGRQADEILIPFARSICVEIDVNNKRILVDLPEGLKDLNRP